MRDLGQRAHEPFVRAGRESSRGSRGHPDEEPGQNMWMLRSQGRRPEPFEPHFAVTNRAVGNALEPCRGQSAESRGYDFDTGRSRKRRSQSRHR
jgi:hypothetical protein